MVTRRENGHLTRILHNFKIFVELPFMAFKSSQTQIQTLFHQFQIHKQHQNSSQIETFDQCSLNKQQLKFQNSKPQMLKLPFLT